MTKALIGFLCYHVWTRLPLRWHDSRIALWMLGRNGDWIYRDIVPIPPEVFEQAAEFRQSADANRAKKDHDHERG
jgi:hypothetical protein